MSNAALVEYYLDWWSNPFAEWPSSRAIENNPHPGRAVAAAPPKPLSGTNFVANFVVHFVVHFVESGMATKMHKAQKSRNYSRRPNCKGPTARNTLAWEKRAPRAQAQENGPKIIPEP